MQLFHGACQMWYYIFKYSIFLVIMFRMAELDICSRKSLLSLDEYEIMTVLSSCPALYLFKKMTEDISTNVLKRPKRKIVNVK